jgi:hypothetical protein
MDQMKGSESKEGKRQSNNENGFLNIQPTTGCIGKKRVTM